MQTVQGSNRVETVPTAPIRQMAPPEVVEVVEAWHSPALLCRGKIGTHKASRSNTSKVFSAGVEGVTL